MYAAYAVPSIDPCTVDAARCSSLSAAGIAISASGLVMMDAGSILFPACPVRSGPESGECALVGVVSGREMVSFSTAPCVLEPKSAPSVSLRAVLGLEMGRTRLASGFLPDEDLGRSEWASETDLFDVVEATDVVACLDARRRALAALALS